MKAGARAVGVAESHVEETSTLGAVVVRRDRAVESVSFGECTVGGLDATKSVGDVVESLARPDARYVFVAGVALAWYNVLNLHALHERLDRPVLAVGFEASDGLEPALREAFDGDALAVRRDTYRSLPPRVPIAAADRDADPAAADDSRFVRAVGVDADRAAAAVRGLTREGFSRCEPLRIAGLAASAHREAAT